MPPPVLGIDLGTVYSRAAWYDDEAKCPVMIENTEGATITPSVIYFGADPPAVGTAAAAYLRNGDPEAATYFKDHLGSKFVWIFGGREWTPVELCGLVLAQLRRDAGKMLGQPVRHTAIAIPVNFELPERAEMIEAGKFAGFEFVYLIPEPVAAILTLEFSGQPRQGIILVADFGGTSSKVSLVSCGRGEPEVLATQRSQYFGGREWDNAVANWLTEQQSAADPSTQETPLAALLAEAERAKRSLFRQEGAELVVPHGGQMRPIELHRAKFEDLTGHLLGQVEQLCEDVFQRAELAWGDLAGVVLLGGSSRLPMISSYFERQVGPEKIMPVSCEDAIVCGAALYAQKLQQSAPMASAALPATAAQAQTSLAQLLHAAYLEPGAAAPAVQYPEAAPGPLQVLDTIVIPHGQEPPQIELCEGDLADLQPGNAVDVLVVSAFPDHYTPMPRSLIGSLYAKGVSVEELASRKEVDLRQAFSCWMSREVLNPVAGVHFRRILCFEPYARGTPAELVGDIFRSLAPFVGGNPPVRTVAMPLVATGYQMVLAEQMLRLIVDAAAHWMLAGLPLTRLKIACLPSRNMDRLRGVFAELKARYGRPPDADTPQYQYDLFLSYAHANGQEVAWLEQQLRERRPDLRLFIDRKELNAGSAWQREIFELLDNCARVVTVYSPAYLASKVCLEEFNIALCRHRELPHPVLAPIYLYSTKLPTYMRLIQFWDCREFDRPAAQRAVAELAARSEP